MRLPDEKIDEAARLMNAFGQHLISHEFEQAVAFFSDKLRKKLNEQTLKAQLVDFLEGDSVKSCEVLLIAESRGIMSFDVSLYSDSDSHPIMCDVKINAVGEVVIFDLEWGYPD